jgi:GalNAc-alpha-(1->4)-GalNAc-alpha-(1->3)-diNAcBac-PP-undecaprenol alpha-1,4-N-acetyl-D-galactosaminyltransferase
MTPRPRVLLVIYSLGAGGAERALSELACHLVAKGWRVTLATFDNGTVPDFYPLAPGIHRHRMLNQVPTHRSYRKIAANMERVRSLRAVMRSELPDVVLSFMETANVLALLAARGLKLPVVAAERIDPAVNNTVPAAWRLARRLLYRRAHTVVAQTAAAAQWLREKCACRSQVIPNALRQLPSLPSGACLTETVSREPIVLSVGRLEAQKGVDVLLRAFACVCSSVPGWRLVVVGDGPLRSTLELLAKQLDISDRVQWIGRTHAVEDWYARCSVVAQASRFEGFPNVVLEAMGMGAAVVSTDCRSGPSELISHGINGLLVPVDDVATLAKSLLLLMNDEPLRQRLGSAALLVRKRYAPDSVFAQWEQLLHRAQQVINTGQPGTPTTNTSTESTR